MNLQNADADSGLPCGIAPDGAADEPPMEETELFRAAQSDACVLFTGREGVEALAFRIHNLSGWRHGPFISVDCGWPEPLLESRLFGGLRPSWPAQRASRFGVADVSDTASAVAQPQATLIQAGTLLLREVGRLSLTFQVRLADALGELRSHSTHRRVRRRVMASTSESLLSRVNDGTFDACLFYRLNVIHLVLPEPEHDRSGSSRE